MKRTGRSGFASEAELAKVVVDWLRAQGWVVYQEVEYRGDIADIVATRGELVAVVEAKLTLGLTVLAQGHRWKGQAHLRWIAVPGYLSRAAMGISKVICSALGLGLLEISPAIYDGEKDRIRIAVEPKEETAGSALAAALRPEHQDYAAAGSPTGHRWSTFRESEKTLLAYVAAHPGELAKVVLAKIPHHWRGRRAHASVLGLIRRGVITGIRVETTAAGARFFPVIPPAQTTTPAVTVTPAMTVSGAHQLPRSQARQHLPRRRRRRVWQR